MWNPGSTTAQHTPEILINATVWNCLHGFAEPKDSGTSKFISVWFPGRQAENISVWREGLKAKWFFHSCYAEPLWIPSRAKPEKITCIMPLDHPRMKEVTLPFTELCSSANPEQKTLSVSGWAPVTKWLKEEHLPNGAKQLKDLSVLLQPPPLWQQEKNMCLFYYKCYYTGYLGLEHLNIAFLNSHTWATIGNIFQSSQLLIIVAQSIYQDP